MATSLNGNYLRCYVIFSTFAAEKMKRHRIFLLAFKTTNLLIKLFNKHLTKLFTP